MPQYDVENRFSYYKSYSDNILVGNPKPAIGDTSWDRVVSGSVVSGSNESRTATVYSKFLFQSQNPFLRSGEVRYVRIASSTQTIQDTIVPNVVDLYIQGFISGTGSILSMSNNPNILNGLSTYALLFSRDGATVTGSNGERINNTEWNFSFPFEKKYFQARKTEIKLYDLKYSYFLDLLYSNIFTYTNPVVIPNVYNYQIILAETTVSGVKTKVFFDYNQPCLPPNGTPVNYFFGPLILDDRSSNSFIFGNNPSFLFSVSGTIGDYTLVNTEAYQAEGWKYGLYNALPTKFSCVFRQNRYGQFRDMLEGRPYTQTYNNPAAGGPLDSGILFISGSALAGESDEWLSASIYNGTDVPSAYNVNPYGSGIYDNYYRASQPWFDNDPRAK
jgi:hypothetical protein